MDKKLIRNALSNLKNLTVKNGIPRTHEHDYNCWGFTANYLGWTAHLMWLYPDHMEKMLKLHSRAVRKPRVGDIVVFRDSEQYLGHTAIISELSPEPLKNQLIHKPAWFELEVTTETDCMNKWVGFGKVTQYRRPIRKKRQKSA